MATSTTTTLDRVHELTSATDTFFVAIEDDFEVISATTSKGKRGSRLLTAGKVYPIFLETPKLYIIKDDLGNDYFIHKKSYYISGGYKWLVLIATSEHFEGVRRRLRSRRQLSNPDAVEN